MSVGAERTGKRIAWVMWGVTAFAVAQGVVFVHLGTWHSLRQWSHPVVFPVRRAIASVCVSHGWECG